MVFSHKCRLNTRYVLSTVYDILVTEIIIAKNYTLCYYNY